MNSFAFYSSRWTSPSFIAVATLAAVGVATFTLRPSPSLGLLLVGGGLVVAAALSLRGRATTPDIPRARLVSRLALSQKSQACLLEVDARSFLIVHADAYAQIVELKHDEASHLATKEGEQ